MSFITIYVKICLLTSNQKVTFIKLHTAYVIDFQADLAIVKFLKTTEIRKRES